MAGAPRRSRALVLPPFKTDLLSHDFSRRRVPGINGGFVVLGQSTSKMRVSEMRDLITLIHAFGAEQSVKFSDESARAAEWAGRFGSKA